MKLELTYPELTIQFEAVDGMAAISGAKPKDPSSRMKPLPSLDVVKAVLLLDDGTVKPVREIEVHSQTDTIHYTVTA